MMPRMKMLAGFLFFIFLAVSLARASDNGIVVGDIEFDESTIHTIGLSLRILSGDQSFNASARATYRPLGSSVWYEALPPQRVRTDTLSQRDPTPFPIAEQFAGSIFDLAADTDYEIVLDIADLEGGHAVRKGTVRTRPDPPEGPKSPHVVHIHSDGGLSDALSAAKPGDVIVLAGGVYAGPIHLTQSGTESEPIVLKGMHRDGTIVEAPGNDYGVMITGSHVILEQVTIRRSAWGIRITNATDVVVRHTRITDVQYGIDATGGTNKKFYICDNDLKGKAVAWPDTGPRTWNFEGIVVTGSGHVICHNTLSGFGDALGLSRRTSIPNRAIDFYGNDVLWGGDDGLELDYSERNVRAFRNRFGNVGMGISFQPIWGGPVYAFRNVIYNTAKAPYKLNHDPSGFHIFHNTAIRPGWAWVQYGYQASNFSFVNNLTVGTENAVNMMPVIRLGRIDFNGWSPDGQFTFTNSWYGFGQLHEHSPYERHGVLLSQPVFRNPIAIPPQFSAFMRPPAAMLHSASNAVDAGVSLPDINDAYHGQAPDLGALEADDPVPSYGVR